jgi:hypothetical protein
VGEAKGKGKGMVKRFRTGLAIAVAAALASTAACTSLNAVQAPPSAKIVAAGETVRVTTKDGKKREIEIDRVSERDVSGQVKDAPFASHRETIKFADIKLIEKRDPRRRRHLHRDSHRPRLLGRLSKRRNTKSTKEARRPVHPGSLWSSCPLGDLCVSLARERSFSA